MPRGTCGLCRKVSDLQDSHLLPRAFYKTLRRAEGKDPIVITSSVTARTSKQVSDYLLCKDCEARFANGGENWVMRKCSRTGTDFPLQAALAAGVAVNAAADPRIYEGAKIAGINVNRLAYFGASVFWRAAVHDWKAILGQKPAKLNLGPYEQELRHFLLGSAFPANAVLTVTVGSSTKAGANETMVFPFLKNDRQKYRQYSFTIPGVTFELFTGADLPPQIRALCTVRSPQHFIYSSHKMDASNAQGMGRLLSNSRRGKNLK